MPGSNLVKQGHPKMPRVERVGEPTVHGGWSDKALFAISKNLHIVAIIENLHIVAIRVYFL